MRGRVWVMSIGLFVTASSAGLMACGGTHGGAASPTAEAPPPRPSPFTTTLDASNPLVGKVWDVAGKKQVDDAALLAAARGAHFVYLGEKHDNPDHHRLQAWVLDALVKSGRKPALAMEQFDAEVQGTIDETRLSHPKDADAIATAVKWSDSGWPPWEQYAPIVRVAVAADLPIIAANLSRGRARAMVRNGPDAMSLDERKKLLLDRPVDAKVAASLKAELDDVHCGMELPPQILEGMAFAERARDATMADRMLDAEHVPHVDSVVLVAGTGHTRLDRGVPSAVVARGRSDKAISIAFVEVAKDVTDPAAYAESWHADALPFDFVLFTPRASDEDPCAGMKHPKIEPKSDKIPREGSGGATM